MVCTLVVVDDFDVIGVAAMPPETNSPLIVDTDAVPAFAIALQGFEPIGGRYAQIEKLMRGIQHPQFAACDLLDFSRQPTRMRTGPDQCRLSISEVLDRHAEA
jgi:hypothetical protein